MNREAERHLTKAAAYLERGESFYAKAAAEMRAAKEAGATWPEIGDVLGRSEGWCRRIIAWIETPANRRSPDTPFGGREERARKDAAATKKVLAEAPLEEVERIVASLPPERQSEIAAAAGHGYHKARQERQDLDVERIAQQADEPRHGPPALRQAVGGFAALGIVGHIEQATEELRELVADASLNATTLREIRRAVDVLVEACDFALALVGEEGDR